MASQRREISCAAARVALVLLCLCAKVHVEARVQGGATTNDTVPKKNAVVEAQEGAPRKAIRGGQRLLHGEATSGRAQEEGMSARDKLLAHLMNHGDKHAARWLSEHIEQHNPPLKDDRSAFYRIIPDEQPRRHRPTRHDRLPPAPWGT